MFVFQETDSTGVPHPVYISMFCYINHQLQGTVLENVVACCFVLSLGHAPVGTLKSLICCSTSLFYDPLVWENVFRALWLFTNRWVIWHIAPQRKKGNCFTQSCILKLPPDNFPTYAVEDFDTVITKMKRQGKYVQVTRLYSLSGVFSNSK